jgi:hypothetical protein
MSARQDLIIMKEGFRSRNYCLSECAQVCSKALSSKTQR